jgi:hypothetical protein
MNSDGGITVTQLIYETPKRRKTNEVKGEEKGTW